MNWIDIKDQKPKEEQEVFYFFEVLGVYAGKYKSVELDEEFIGQKGIYMDCFYGEGGFLCDDVTHWRPRSEGDEFPDVPKYFEVYDDDYDLYERDY